MSLIQGYSSSDEEKAGGAMVEEERNPHNDNNNNSKNKSSATQETPPSETPFAKRVKVASTLTDEYEEFDDDEPDIPFDRNAEALLMQNRNPRKFMPCVRVACASYTQTTTRQEETQCGIGNQLINSSNQTRLHAYRPRSYWQTHCRSRWAGQSASV